MTERISTPYFTIDLATRTPLVHSVISEHPAYWQEMHARIVQAAEEIGLDLAKRLKEVQ